MFLCVLIKVKWDIFSAHNLQIQVQTALGFTNWILVCLHVMIYYYHIIIIYFLCPHLSSPCLSLWFLSPGDVQLLQQTLFDAVVTAPLEAYWTALMLNTSGWILTHTCTHSNVLSFKMWTFYMTTCLFFLLNIYLVPLYLLRLSLILSPLSLYLSLSVWTRG